ncbi:MAG: ATP-grasp domain-containing protein [Pirellulaceae bacterium]
MPTTEARTHFVDQTCLIAASARWMAQSLTVGSPYLTAIDLFADTDLRRTATAHQVSSYQLLQQHFEFSNCQIFIGGGLESHVDSFQFLHGNNQILNWGPGSIRAVRDFFSFQMDAAQFGFLAPRSFQMAQDATSQNVATLLIKDMNGTGGSHVRVMDWETSTVKHGRRYIFQEYISGTTYGAAFLSDRNRTQLLGVTQQLLGDGNGSEFCYAGSVGPITLPQDQLQQLLRFGEWIRVHYNAVGLWGVDFIVADSGCLWFVDVNPRPTASMEILEKGIGIALMPLHAEAFHSNVPSVAIPDSTNAFCKRIVYWSGEPLMISHEHSKRLLHWLEAGRIADVPETGTVVERDQPFVTLFAEAESPESAIQLTERLSQELIREIRA